MAESTWTTWTRLDSTWLRHRISTDFLTCFYQLLSGEERKKKERRLFYDRILKANWWGKCVQVKDQWRIILDFFFRKCNSFLIYDSTNNLIRTQDFVNIDCDWCQRRVRVWRVLRISSVRAGLVVEQTFRFRPALIEWIIISIKTTIDRLCVCDRKTAGREEGLLNDITTSS